MRGEVLCRYMADDALTDLLLDHAPDGATARRMFGGVGIFLDGKMFALVHQEEAYLKIDDATRPRFEERGSGPFQPSPRQTIRSYYRVPDDVLADGPTLREWMGYAVDAAQP